MGALHRVLRSALLVFGVFGASLIWSSASVQGAGAPLPELRVLAYDSLMASGGLGREVFERFEKRCGCRVVGLPSGDGGQLMARLELDSGRVKASAHLVMGLDQGLWSRAARFVEAPSEPIRAAYVSPVAEELAAAGEAGRAWVAYNYGHFAWMVDRDQLSKLGLEQPRRLSDLLKPAWKRQIILQDPRTSTPGYALLAMTRTVMEPKEWEEFWSAFRTQWLTLASGWDAAYGLFLKGEAPLVWSYVTSQAYHAEHGDREGRYRAVLLEEGAPIQVEAAALVKGAFGGPEGDRLRRIAREFLAFLVSAEAQELVPRHNWMLPVVKGTRLPKSFESLPVPRRSLRALGAGAPTQESLLSEWSRVIRGARP